MPAFGTLGVRVVSNAALLWAVRIVTLSSSALLGVLTARLLGPAGRGEYVLPAIDAGVSTTFAAGLSSGVVYFLLNRRADASIVRAALIVLLIFIAGGIGAALATALLTHSLRAAVPAAAFVAAYAVYSLAYGLYLGTDRARAAGLLNAAAYVLTLLFVSAALRLDRSSPRLAIAGFVAGMAVAGATGLALASRDALRLSGTVVASAELLRFAARAGLVNFANLLNYRIDIYVVAILAPVSAVGMYTLAVTGAESVLSLTLAVSQAAIPHVGALERGAAAGVPARCLRNGIFLAFMLAAAGAAAAPLVVHAIFGPGYATIVAPLRVLLIGLVAASTSAMISNYFVLNRGRVRVPLVTSAISTAVCAGLSFALVPRIGLLGAALGSTVAYITSQSVALWFFCDETGVAWERVLLVDRQDMAYYGRLMRRIVARA